LPLTGHKNSENILKLSNIKQYLFLKRISLRFTQRSATPLNIIIEIIDKYGQGVGILFRSVKSSVQLSV